MSSAKRSRRFLFGVIIVLLAIALLYVTNPSEEQFASFLKHQIREQAEGDETLAGDMKRILSGPAAMLAGMGTVRTDYFLCSTYKMDLPGGEHLYLGLIDHFIRLK